MTSYLYIFLSSWKIVSHTALLPPLIPLGCGTFSPVEPKLDQLTFGHLMGLLRKSLIVVTLTLMAQIRGFPSR
jgi:hypothetical protein